MPPVREVHNARARQLSAGIRKKGKAKKKQADEQATRAESDSNVEILIPKNKEDKNREKKEKLLQELAAQSESKWTSKKKKRLEKYIEKKLRKDDRVLLFEKLAQSQASVTSSLLQSSSTLGSGKPTTLTELEERFEDKIIRTILGRKRKRQPIDVQEGGDDILSDAYSHREQSVSEHGGLEDDGFSTKSFPFATSESKSRNITVGSALHRNPDGSLTAPTVRKNVKKKSMRGWARKAAAEADSGSATSFDSSDSGYDSPVGETTYKTAGCDQSNGNDNDNDKEMEVLSPDDKGVDKCDPIHLKEGQTNSKKSFGFKDWALRQLCKAKDGDLVTVKPDEEISGKKPLQPPSKKIKVVNSTDNFFRGPLGESLELPATSLAQQVMASGGHNSSPSYVKVVEVKRPPDVENARILLPIATEEQPIMEAILFNPVVIICGETGSGKTTQVPQFLYEAGFGTPGSDNPGMIGVTQPRRVAAVAMAQRVAYELSLSSHVSYQVRYDATVSPSTCIKFMTDGILLRELAADFLLTKYSVIIIDEAHERNINTDILIGILSRVVKVREELWKQKKDDAKPLRLVIMSATLRVSDFAENKTLFASTPPIITVGSRQHPVTIHFSRRTHADYVTQAIRKVIKIHNQLPSGGILVFLTGQSEIVGVCRKLEARFSQKAIDAKRRRQPTGFENSAIASLEIVSASQAPIEVEDVELQDTDPDEINDSNELSQDSESESGLEDDFDRPMHVVPLYSLLSNEKQLRVFQPPPPNCRLVVVSTNIAETSLTIPGIRYVVDCGKVKERRYDVASGVQSFQVSWISKASAAQRAGRAGRTGPGHCYRLYSSAFFEHHFDSFPTPEIQRMPIDGVVLQMKSMHIDTVTNFPFPSPPHRQALHKAEQILTYLGALTPTSKTAVGQITDLGRAMSLFPLSPRFSRMLVTGQQHSCLPYVICIVSALSVGDPFTYVESLEEDDGNRVPRADESLAVLKSEDVRAREARCQLRKAFHDSQHIHASLGKYTSDLFKLLSVIGAYEYTGGGLKFCSENFVRPKAMEEIRKLRAQISNIVLTNFPGTNPNFSPRLTPPSDCQLKVLRQILTAGFIDQVAVRKDLLEKSTPGIQYATSKGIPYKALGVEEDVFLHPSSIFMNSPPPAYLVFNEIVRTSKTFLRGLTVINPAWLSALGKDTLCSFSKPLQNNVGILMAVPKFGPDGWELPAIKADKVFRDTM